MGAFDWLGGGIGTLLGGPAGGLIGGDADAAKKIMDPGNLLSPEKNNPNLPTVNPDLASFGPSPYSSALADALKSMPGFQPISGPTPITAEGSTYQSTGPYKGDAYVAKDMSNAPQAQFDAMRRRLDTQYSRGQSQAQDALDRQFAAAGGGPGNGAQAKQTENLASSIAAQKGNDLEGINTQEAQAREALQQQESQKEFQSQEAQKGYGFQSGQADIGRKFAADEAAAGRKMSAQEFNDQMEQTGKQFNAQMGQQENQFKFNANSTIAGLNTAWDQAQAEAKNNEFNRALSEWQARHSGGLLGGGGFLGTGLFN